VIIQFAPLKDLSDRNVFARNKVRLCDPKTRAFLHLSGAGTTTDVQMSWLGLRRQAEVLRQRARARGEGWPFAIVRRDFVDTGHACEHGSSELVVTI